MQAAQRIRAAVTQVSELRLVYAAQPALAQAAHQIKRVQSLRFRASYADLTQTALYGPAIQFFLEELYSERDFSQRDAQFARIAGPLQRFFPHDVVATAEALARVHALTETLDLAMAQAWLAQDGAPAANPGQRYLGAWRAVGLKAEREAQLQEVLVIGHEVARLTRVAGLRMMLRMMRGPASAAGLSDLQQFLETGFDRFAAMARQKGQAEQFLATVQARESTWIRQWFEGDFVTCATELDRTLGQVR